MNHLRELLEAIPNGIGVDPCIQEADADRYLSWAEQGAQGAVCFWMGDIDQVSELKAPPELVRMPFKTCWFEGEAATDDAGNRALIGILANETPGEIYAGEVLVFMRHKHRWALMLACGLEYNGGVGVCGVEPDVLSGAKYAMHALKAFCCAINCTNVIRREHKPDAALQKARAKKSKDPLFSFWTLELNGRSEDGQILGGSHSSPRVHLVRGHPREYQPGKWTWVQAHARGNRAHGMVHKDYSAGPALVAAAQ